jgi:prepilin-type N-terminal cleavage/methylation domain-containing protein
MRRAFSLVECCTVLAVMGILLAIVAPAARAPLDRLRTEAAVRRLTMALSVARRAATMHGAVATLTVDSLGLRVVVAPDSQPVWQGPGPSVDGVTLTNVPGQHRFAPGGLGLGLANATYELSRGQARVRVIVSRYGRLRVER